MSLVNINGDDHVSLATPFPGQLKVLDSEDRGQFQGYNFVVFPPVSSFQVTGFASSLIQYDGYRPDGLKGILKLEAPISSLPPRPESGLIYPRGDS